ncbi:hypothetical protein [Parasphingorhabdus sp.]|uniref:hypothetical protein n=1 Tax=Parasphingorhabdus sp. TaxID=2709688 RepID=UPI0030A3B247|nr:hypothetical protein [Sphingomonadales bacterium]
MEMSFFGNFSFSDGVDSYLAKRCTLAGSSADNFHVDEQRELIPGDERTIDQHVFNRIIPPNTLALHAPRNCPQP